MHAKTLICLICALVTLPLTGCGKKEEGPETPESRGRRAYVTYCVVCHNADPRKDGTTGPAIAGASQELVEAKTLRQTYPLGYKPKRTTKTMPAYPQVKTRISDLTAFLNAAR
jgi:mono/diheme cytochrome c family protein